MPNWCSTTYCIEGDTNQLLSLYERMKVLQEMKEPLAANGFGSNWLGCLVEDFGENHQHYSCRGSWSDLSFDGNLLRFNTETAWYRCTEVEDLIREKYPDIEISFYCEESGMCIYETNNRNVFPEEVILYIDGEYEYSSREEIVDMLSDRFNIDIDDLEQAKELIVDYNEKLDEDSDDEEIYLHEIVEV